MICDICSKEKSNIKEFKHPFYVLSVCKDCLAEEELESFAMRCFRLGYKVYDLEVK